MSGAKTTLTTLRARTKKKTNAKQRQAMKEHNQTRDQITAEKQLVNFTIRVKDAQKETSALSCILIKALRKKAEASEAPMMMSAMIRRTMTDKMIKYLAAKSTTESVTEKNLKRRRAKF